MNRVSLSLSLLSLAGSMFCATVIVPAFRTGLGLVAGLWVMGISFVQCFLLLTPARHTCKRFFGQRQRHPKGRAEFYCFLTALGGVMSEWIALWHFPINGGC